MKAPLPANEERRLAALRSYDILDTPGEQAFDDLTLLAAHICGTPIAMVSLVDDERQWFKSKTGLSVSETSRDIAFCAHTILQPGEVLEVRDAEADPRFAGSPLVKMDPHIRFYAGAPLVTPAGEALGALCVMDNTPRNLTAEQLDALRALSRRVVAQLELRRQAKELALREKEADRLLKLAERSRLSLLSVLEDERLSAHNLRESEARFRQVVENIREVFWMNDVEKKSIIYISPGFEHIWGRPCADIYADPRTWPESLHPDDRERVLQAADTKQVSGTYDETYRIVRPDGSLRWIRARGFPVPEKDGRVRRVVGVAEDITDQKKLEEQFLHAQRMEAIGTLASGVAHDLNNILSPILMVAGILKQRSSATPKDLELLAIIERSSQRGADIIRQLLTFSRSLPGERGPVQLKHLVRDMVGIMKETFPRNIAIQEVMPADLWVVEADPTQLHQVIMNLCVNARDAMPGGGTLSVAVDNVMAGDEAGSPPELRPGPCVRLQVKDTGTGIPPEIVHRIFEPFFTTKGVGKGTGLGLSTVVGIIKGHGGTVKVESEPGCGTTFLVYLPASASVGATARNDSSPPLRLGKDELVLVVDDEPSILEAARVLLEKNGYRVLTAESGEAAVKLFIQHQETLRLVLTDIMLPGMDGLALIKVLRGLRPTLPIIATSGLDQSQNRQELAGLGITQILAKPSAPAALLAAIEQALAG